jgi:hypothetical protein
VRVSIDRIEGGVAVLLARDDFPEWISIPVSLLPAGSKEGDILTLTLEVDPADTAATKKRVDGLIEKLKMKR